MVAFSDFESDVRVRGAATNIFLRRRNSILLRPPLSSSSSPFQLQPFAAPHRWWFMSSQDRLPQLLVATRSLPTGTSSNMPLYYHPPSVPVDQPVMSGK